MIKGMKETAAATTALFSAFVAPAIRMAELLHALLVGHAGPAAPLEADPIAPVAYEPRVMRYFAVDTVLSEPFATGPDRGAASSVAIPIAALAVVRAVALRHILGPSSGQRDPVCNDAILDDRFVERRERSVWRRVARVHLSVR
jgi:hypothetical protein